MNKKHINEHIKWISKLNLCKVLLFDIYESIKKVVIIPVFRFLPCIFVFVFKNNFLDYYVAYLRDLPECISLVHVVVLKEVSSLYLCTALWLHVYYMMLLILPGNTANALSLSSRLGMAWTEPLILLPGVKEAHSRISTIALVLALPYWPSVSFHWKLGKVNRFSKL